MDQSLTHSQEVIYKARTCYVEDEFVTRMCGTMKGILMFINYLLLRFMADASGLAMAKDEKSGNSADSKLN